MFVVKLREEVQRAYFFDEFGASAGNVAADEFQFYLFQDSQIVRQQQVADEEIVPPPVVALDDDGWNFARAAAVTLPPRVVSGDEEIGLANFGLTDDDNQIIVRLPLARPPLRVVFDQDMLPQSIATAVWASVARNAAVVFTGKSEWIVALAATCRNATVAFTGTVTGIATLAATCRNAIVQFTASIPGGAVTGWLVALARRRGRR